MLSFTMDLSQYFAAGASGTKNIEVGGYQTLSVQLINPSGNFFFQASSDSGAVQGVSDGNASTAINFNPVMATDISTNTSGTLANTSGNYSINIEFRFLQILSDAGVTADKVLVFLTKPY
jgi:hypothetical protein